MSKLSTKLRDTEPLDIPPCWSLEPQLSVKPEAALDGWTGYWEKLGGTERFFREQAKEYVHNLEHAAMVHPTWRALDFGCGFGFVAQMLAPKVKQLSLWDASANMRRNARANVAGHENIRFLDFSDGPFLRSDMSFDLILVNSVVQYMSLKRLSTSLELWSGILSPGGRIIVSDLIPLSYPLNADIVDMLKFSLRRGILGSALLQSFRDLGRYWRMRRNHPLTRVDPEQLREMGQAAGFNLECLSRNLTQFTRRYTVVFSNARLN